MRWYNKSYQPPPKAGDKADAGAEQSQQRRSAQNPYRVPEAVKSATFGRGRVMAFVSLAFAVCSLATFIIAPLEIPTLLVVLPLALGGVAFAIVSIRHGYRGLLRTVALILSIAAIALFVISFGPLLEMGLTTPPEGY